MAIPPTGKLVGFFTTNIMTDKLKKSIAIFSLLLLPLYLMINNSAIEDVSLKKKTDTQIINLLKDNEITSETEELYGYKVTLVEEKPSENIEGTQQQIELQKGENVHVWASKIIRKNASPLDTTNPKIIINNNSKTSYELSSINKVEPLMASAFLYFAYLIYLYKFMFESKPRFFSLLNYGSMYFFFFALTPVFIEAFTYPTNSALFTDKNLKILLWNGFLVITFLNYNMGSMLNSVYEEAKKTKKETTNEEE